MCLPETKVDRHFLEQGIQVFTNKTDKDGANGQLLRTDTCAVNSYEANIVEMTDLSKGEKRSIAQEESVFKRIHSAQFTHTYLT